MSSQNVTNTGNRPTDEVLSKHFKVASMDQMKKIKFDFGCGVSFEKMREMLRLKRFVCNNICYLNQEDIKTIRENIIKNAILKLDDL